MPPEHRPEQQSATEESSLETRSSMYQNGEALGRLYFAVDLLLELHPNHHHFHSYLEVTLEAQQRLHKDLGVRHGDPME